MTTLVDHLLTTTLVGDCTHETLGFATHYPPDLDSLAVKRVFVTITEHGQIGHAHHFTDIDRYGAGLCHPCGAAGWSPGWVRDGVMSGHNISGTVDWIGRSLDWRCAQLETDREDVAVLLLGETLGAVVVETVPLVAARTDGSDEARQRPGVPVPVMQRGVLTVQS